METTCKGSVGMVLVAKPLEVFGMCFHDQSWDLYKINEKIQVTP